MGRFARAPVHRAALGTVVCLVLSMAAHAAAFFPERPVQASMHTMVGILIDYGVGADAGGFDLQTARGTVLNFAVGHAMTIDGTLVRCTAPAVRCPHWPRSIVLRRSKVRVTYWNAVLAGRPLRISSEIDPAGAHAGSGGSTSSKRK